MEGKKQQPPSHGTQESASGNVERQMSGGLEQQASGETPAPPTGRVPSAPPPEWSLKTIVTTRVSGPNGSTAGLGIGLRKAYSENFFRLAAIHPTGSLAGREAKIGDILVSVDGINLKGYNEETTMRLLRGQPESEVTLVLGDDGGGPDLGADEPHYFVTSFAAGQWSVVVQRGPEGLGMDISKAADEEHFQVLLIDPEGPVGLTNKVNIGNFLLAIDGKPLADKSADEVSKLLKGPIGQRVQLTIGENESMDILKNKSRRFKTSVRSLQEMTSLRNNDLHRATSDQTIPSRVESSNTVPSAPAKQEDERDPTLSSSVLPEFFSLAPKPEPLETPDSKPAEGAQEGGAAPVFGAGTLGATGLKELEDAPRRAREQRIREAKERAAARSMMDAWADWFGVPDEKQEQWWWSWR